MRHLLPLTLLMIALAGSAQAQLFRRAPVSGAPPKGTPPAEAEIWPFPPPDPQAWWDEKRPVPSEAADPLGGRREAARERPIALSNGVDPSTYRLWGLMPLQWQLLRGQEMILEVWVHPTRSVRQSVVRIIVRNDGRGFVEARAGLACCEAGIARRLGFDADLTVAQAQAFMALRGHTMWAAPHDVGVVEPGAVEGVCVDGAGYDLTLVVPGRARSLRRACDPAAIGQVADALEPALAAALGHDGRFDVLYPAGASFAAAREAYRDLIAHGGTLKAQPRTLPSPAETAAKPPAPEPAPSPPASGAAR